MGEIWVNSPSKAQGYRNHLDLPEQFRATTRGTTNNDGSVGGFLRGGPGLLLKRELFICGRIKDLIIVRGSNHYPQDIERMAEKACGASLRAGCSAAAVRDEVDLSRGRGSFLLAGCALIWTLQGKGR